MAKEPDTEDDFNDFELPDEDKESKEGLEEELEEDDLFSDIDDLSLIGNEASGKSHGEASPPPETPSSLQNSSSVEPKGMVPLTEIPVTIVVEIGQVSMKMDQLLKLEPGNLLDVNLQPENGVDLTINGKLVGKGELLRIGDVIGVRILQLGSA